MSYLTVIRSHDRKVAINYYYYYNLLLSYLSVTVRCDRRSTKRTLSLSIVIIIIIIISVRVHLIVGRITHTEKLLPPGDFDYPLIIFMGKM